MMITNNQPYPAANIFIIFCLFNLFIAYPGGMTSDSIDQFCQSITLSFDNHHPPLTSMLWSLLNKIYAGPQLLLLLHLSLLWSGAAFMYFSNPANKYRSIYFVIPFLPMISTQSGLIWKDVGFGCAFFFTSAVAHFISCRCKLDAKKSWLIIIVMSAILFYGMSVKFQGQFVLPIIYFYIFNSIFKKRLARNILLTFVFSALLISLNNMIMKKYSQDSNAWQLKYIFDLAAVAKMLDDDSVLPEYVRQQETYNFDALKRNFTHKWVDPLIFPEDRIYTSVSEDEKLNKLKIAHHQLIKKHTLLYLKHRLHNLFYLLKANYNRSHLTLPIPKDLCGEYNYHAFENNIPNKFFDQLVRIFPKLLGVNLFSVIVICIVLYFQLSRSANIAVEDKHFSLFVMIFSLSLISILLFFSMASDYRYLFIVRVLTLFNIPILLNHGLGSCAK